MSDDIVAQLKADIESIKLAVEQVKDVEFVTDDFQRSMFTDDMSLSIIDADVSDNDKSVAIGELERSVNELAVSVDMFLKNMKGIG